jgi:SSS family solute:Na+ symporter
MPGSRANSLTARSKAAEGSSIVQKYGIFVPMINGPYLVLAVLAGYFALLVVVAEWATRQSAADNTQFFTAGRQSPWWLVSFGMIGASLSGVTFVSVPGWVATSQFSYLQMVLGYVAGYAVVAFVLLPLYYRTATTTIYGYLDQRFGISAYRTGAWIFIVSRWVGSSLRLFLVATILHDLVAKPFGVPFGVTVLGVLGLIWLYTHRGGIRAVVVTDTLQTAAMLAVLIWVIVVLMGELGVEQPWTWLWEQPESQWFFPEASDGRNFWKQFLGGMFITITMTGLDQDMMQKNLTCRTLRDAQLNMMVFSGVLVFVNLLFLALGVVLYRYASSVGIETTGDGLFAAVAMSPGMPQAVAVHSPH